MSESNSQSERQARRMLECADIIGQSLSKSRGIMFVISQVKNPELESDELTRNAIWAVNDFLQDAAKAWDEYSETAQQRVVR